MILKDLSERLGRELRESSCEQLSGRFCLGSTIAGCSVREGVRFFLEGRLGVALGFGVIGVAGGGAAFRAGKEWVRRVRESEEM